MKLSTRQIVTAVLLALLGAGELAIQAQDNTDTRSQSYGATASEDAKKSDASKKPRGLLADSFFWPATTDVNPRKSTPLTPPPLPGLADRPLMGGTERPVVPAPIVAAPIVPVPAMEMNSPPAPVVSAAEMAVKKPVAAKPVSVAPPMIAPAEKPAVFLAETTFVAPSSQPAEPPTAIAPHPEVHTAVQPAVAYQQPAPQPTFAPPAMAPQVIPQQTFVQPQPSQQVMAQQVSYQPSPVSQSLYQPLPPTQVVVQQPMFAQPVTQQIVATPVITQPSQQLLIQPASWSMNNPSLNQATDQQMHQLQQNVQQLQQNVQQVQQAQHAQQFLEPVPVSSIAACSCSDAECCSSCDCCPDPLWMHRSGVFADFLYLRPGNIDYVYAVEQTGTLPSDVQTGPVGRVGFDVAPGYRIGLTHCLSDCSSIQVNYTWFQDSTHDSITANGINVLVFQPGLPQIPNVGSSSIQSTADYNIRFQQLDIDYRGLLYGTCDSAVNYFAGVRYANLEQNFQSQQTVGQPVGLTTVRTDINFDGFGIGAGIDGMRRRADTGLLVYGKASASFLAGEFKADYRQTQQFGPNSIAGNTLADYRVMTILQTELGLGWRSCCGRYQLTGGYQFSGCSML